MKIFKTLEHLSWESIIEHIRTVGIDGLGALFVAFIFDQILDISIFLGAMAIFVIVDFITGAWASLKEHNKVTSLGIGVTIEKLLIYFIALILAHILEVLFVPFVPLVKTVAFFILFREAQSNYENIERITGVELWPAIWTLLLRWLRK